MTPHEFIAPDPASCGTPRTLCKWLMVTIVAAVAGCASKTETGYEPRKLSDSEVVRRGYYAPAFSPEAHEAAMDRGVDRKPGGY